MATDRQNQLFPTAGDAHRYCKKHGLDISMVDDNLWSIAEALYNAENKQVPDDPSLPKIGLKKARKIGETIGLLVQNPDGKVAAVTHMGRVTWLRQEVVGPPVWEATDEGLEKALEMIRRLRNNACTNETERLSNDLIQEADRFLEKHR